MIQPNSTANSLTYSPLTVRFPFCNEIHDGKRERLAEQHPIRSIPLFNLHLSCVRISLLSPDAPRKGCEQVTWGGKGKTRKANEDPSLAVGFSHDFSACKRPQPIGCFLSEE